MLKTILVVAATAVPLLGLASGRDLPWLPIAPSRPTGHYNPVYNFPLRKCTPR